MARLPTRRKSAPRRQLDRLPAGRDLGSLYSKHFEDPRKERLLISTSAFIATFAVTRAITHAIKNDKLPVGNISSGGKHIHHMTFGIFALLGTGYAWGNQVGLGDNRRERRGSRLTSGLYGAGAALTLDEFALWLNLEDDYWTKEGRESIDAVVLFASVLTLSLVGKEFLRELTETAAKHRPKQALIRGRRLARHHPRRALGLLRG